MSDQLSLGLLALILGIAVGTLAFLPYVAMSYRRHGRLTAGRTGLAFALLVYFLAIWTYTLLPLPDPDEIRCTTPQLNPWVLVEDLGTAAASGSPLTNPAFLQIALNVLLFLPLGFFVRLIWHRGWVTATLVGFALSLLIETTQLTGVWGIYPCAYRLFDVEDLITNTLGALLGGILSLAIPLRLRARSGEVDDARAPRPVSAARRLVGMTCDVLSVVLGSLAVGVILSLVDFLITGGDVSVDAAFWYQLAGNMVPLAVTLAYMLLRGRTIGNDAVQLQYVGARMPVVWSRLVRFLGGIGGYQLLSLLPDPWSLSVPALVLVSFVLVFTTKGHRGLPGLLSGQRLVDSRTPVKAERALERA
ncbi:VanZ family protein [uncultured Microbacterium sp.]|uniref:VanZ family protein n=1 Tax=uncultured Microbacterium sp. TaxID=191216 RepID=UPI0028D3A520|nr:VanZ family protein [uncultured Microbacterium sp.]